MNQQKKLYQSQINDFVKHIKNNQLNQFQNFRKWVNPTDKELIQFKEIFHHVARSGKIFEKWLIQSYQKISNLKLRKEKKSDDVFCEMWKGCLMQFPDLIQFLENSAFHKTGIQLINQVNNITINNLTFKIAASEVKEFLKIYQKLNFAKISLKKIHQTFNNDQIEQLLDLYAYHLKFFNNNQIEQLLKLILKKRQNSKIVLSQHILDSQK